MLQDFASLSAIVMAPSKQYTTDAMKKLGVPASSLGKRVQKVRKVNNQALDFLATRERLAFVEVVDIMVEHPSVRQALRDFAEGKVSNLIQGATIDSDNFFCVSPTTVASLDEDFCAGVVEKLTKLGIEYISMARAFDCKFPQKMVQLFLNAVAGCKVPAGSENKKVLFTAIKARTEWLGLSDELATFRSGDRRFLASGKVLWPAIGVYRFTYEADMVITIKNIFTLITIDVSAEDITTEFEVHRSWCGKTAFLAKGSRRHTIIDFFSEECKRHPTMLPWTGQSREFIAHIAQATTSVANSEKISDSTKVVVDHTTLMKETVDVKRKALAKAKETLLQRQEETKKKRRTSIADIVPKKVMTT